MSTTASGGRVDASTGRGGAGGAVIIDGTCAAKPVITGRARRTGLNYTFMKMERMVRRERMLRRTRFRTRLTCNS